MPRVMHGVAWYHASDIYKCNLIHLYCQVTEVDGDGNRVRVHGCGYLNDDIIFKGNMQYIVLDDRNRAFVADVGNCRILLTTGQPATERVISTLINDDDDTPGRNSTASRLSYIRSTGQLCVVMATRYRIIVYSTVK